MIFTNWGKYVPLDKGIDYEAMYGEDLVQYRKVLEAWYGDDISLSPFLTEFPCKVLGLNDYIPTTRAEEKLFTPHTSTHSATENIIDRVEALAKFLIWIEKQETNIHTEMLRKHVQDVHQQETNKSYDQAILRLKDYGEVGNRIISIMSRLKEGQENSWNPYWMNSGVKLKGIISGLKALKPTDLLDEVLFDQESNLYKAVNMSRLSPFTFWGAFGVNQSKSLQLIEENVPVDDSYNAVEYPY